MGHQTDGAPQVSILSRLFGNGGSPASAPSRVQNLSVRGRGRPRQDERNAEIIRKYQSGVSVVTLGDEYGITRERVCQILRADNLTNLKREQLRVAREVAENNRAKITAEVQSMRAAKVAEAVDLVRNGASRSQAVTATRLPSHVVLKACIDAGLARVHGRWGREAEFQTRRKLILALRAENKTWAEIKKIHGFGLYAWALRNVPEIRVGMGNHRPRVRATTSVTTAAPMPSPDVWTPERIATLCRMYFDGCSAQHIADLLGEGFTHNSVIGKINRLRAAKQLLPVTAA